jgi:3alpha(or 20beta)-hydroxysteroid dehydrogenase
MGDELAGKVALVSGAARGQGASHARLLAANGAAVVLGDLLDDLGLAVAEEIRSQGCEAVYTHLDVRSNEDWDAAVALAEERYGRLNILANNAGKVAHTGVEDCTDEEWDEIIAINQGGVFRGTRAAIPAMRRTGYGSIINTSSTYGISGTWGYAAYVASKHAVIGLTRSTAIQYSHENIRCNAICPGACDTPMLAEELEIFEADPNFDWDVWLSKQPIRRVCQPEEISAMVLFLASERSSFATGGVFSVDGGNTAGPIG